MDRPKKNKGGDPPGTGMMVPNKTRPRVRDVQVTDHGSFALEVTWSDGSKDLVNLADMIDAYKVFAPLRSGDMFRHVRVGEYGWDICWTDDIDMSADTLWRLAQEQSGNRAPIK
jgi:hypothetical protein